MNKRQRPEVHPEADADLDRQYEWLQNHYCSPSTLHKFLDAVEAAKAKIGDNPKMWSRVRGSRNIHKVQIKKFRMTVI
jgi:hypothetical protein